MGLTIHYSFRSDAGSPEQARHQVEKLRQAALDLAMAEVSEVVEFSEADCGPAAGREGVTRWLITQAHCLVDLGEAGYRLVPPTRFFAFTAWPGRECEVATFGLRFTPN